MLEILCCFFFYYYLIFIIIIIYMVAGHIVLLFISRISEIMNWNNVNKTNYMQTHLCYTQKKGHTENSYVVLLMSYWSKTEQIYMVMLYYFCHHSMYKSLIRTRTSTQLTLDANKKITNITISESEVRKQTFKQFTVYVSSPMKQIIGCWF